jgi:hypothetical protein
LREDYEDKLKMSTITIYFIAFKPFLPTGFISRPDLAKIYFPKVI